MIKFNKKYEKDISIIDDDAREADPFTGTDIVQVLYINIATNKCIDIDVRPGNDLFKFTNDSEIYELKGLDKTFPDVEYLYIDDKYVLDIRIKNMLFPNVAHVASRDIRFVSQTNLLVRKSPFSFSTTGTLLNVFHKQYDDVINLYEVNAIEEFAFEGCMSKNIRQMPQYLSIAKNAFYNSAFEKLPYKKGAVCYKHALLFIDENAEDVFIPSKVSIIPAYIDFSSKNVTVEDFDTAKLFSVTGTRSCKSLNIMYSRKNHMQRYTIQEESHDSIFRYNTEHVNILDQTNRFFVKDDILYEEGGEVLASFLTQKSVDVIIPDGVRYICKNAFNKSNITSVKFSDSIDDIGYKAFAECDRLSHVEFGKGLSSIGSGLYVFSNCKSLTYIEFPDNITSINVGAFQYSSLKSVKLPNNIFSIGGAAFKGCPIEKLELPEAIRCIHEEALIGTKDITITGDNIPTHIIKSIMQKPYDESLKNALGHLFYITVRINDIEFCIPTHTGVIDNDIIERIRRVAGKHKADCSESELEDVYCLYEFCLGASMYEKSKLYMKAYENGSKRAIRDIDYKFESMCIALVSNNDEQGLVALLKVKNWDKKRLLFAKSLLTDNKFLIARAYILNLICSYNINDLSL